MKRKALYAIYKKGLTEGRFSSMREAGIWISTQPAPCFYLSPETASILIGRVLAHQSLVSYGTSQRRMVRQLYSDYKEYLSIHPNTKRSRIDILDELVQRPAPEFYMSPDAIRRELRGEIAYVRRKTGWGE